MSFCFVYGFLSCKKAFKFNLVPFVSFCFCSFHLRRQIQNNIAVICVKGVLPMLSSRSFLVSGLLFKSLIPFEFNFVCSMRKCCNFILLHATVQFSLCYLLKKRSFLCILCLLCRRLIGHKNVGLFLGFLFCSTDLCICFCAVTVLFS